MATRKHRYDCAGILQSLGISPLDAAQLMRISATLHRWHELECGMPEGIIEREGDDGEGRPLFIPASPRGDYRREHGYRIPDRENGAMRRLVAIMARYPLLGYYVQGDPRGCSLYIIRPGDVPEGENVDAYYSRGIAVYRDA